MYQKLKDLVKITGDHVGFQIQLGEYDTAPDSTQNWYLKRQFKINLN